MRRILWLLLPTSVFAADLASKHWILSFLREGETYRVIDGFFNLSLAFNRGAIFGSLTWIPEGPRFALFTLAGLVSLGYFGHLFLAKGTPTLGRVGLGMILGGALGNGLDRWMRGYVVDFLDFVFGSWHYWTFNLADSFILVGVVLCAWSWLKGSSPSEVPASDNS